MSIKDAENDDGVVIFDGEVDGIGEGVDGFNPDIIVTDSGGGRQAADLAELSI